MGESSDASKPNLGSDQLQKELPGLVTALKKGEHDIVPVLMQMEFLCGRENRQNRLPMGIGSYGTLAALRFAMAGSLDAKLSCCQILRNLAVEEEVAIAICQEQVLLELLHSAAIGPSGNSTEEASLKDKALTVFFHLSDVEENRRALLYLDSKSAPAGIVNTCCRPLIQEDNYKAQRAMMFTAILVGREESGAGGELLTSNPALIDKIVALLRNVLTDEQYTKKWGWKITHPLYPLRNLCIADKNKEQLATKDNVMLLAKVLENHFTNKRACRLAVGTLLELSFLYEEEAELTTKLFDEDVRHHLLPLLDKDGSPEADHVKHRIKEAQSTNSSKGKHTCKLQQMMEAVSQNPSNAEDHGAPSELTESRHIMMSYSWAAKKEHVIELANLLRSKGFDVWRDEDGSTQVPPMGQGGVDEIMALAVEKAALVIVFVSKAYKESANCRMEGQYANRERKHGNVEVAFVMMDENYTTVSKGTRVDGWLGIMIGDALWYPAWDHSQLVETADRIAGKVVTLPYQVMTTEPEDSSASLPLGIPQQKLRPSPSESLVPGSPGRSPGRQSRGFARAATTNTPVFPVLKVKSAPGTLPTRTSITSAPTRPPPRTSGTVAEDMVIATEMDDPDPVQSPVPSVSPRTSGDAAMRLSGVSSAQVEPAFSQISESCQLGAESTTQNERTGIFSSLAKDEADALDGVADLVQNFSGLGVELVQCWLIEKRLNGFCGPFKQQGLDARGLFTLKLMAMHHDGFSAVQLIQERCQVEVGEALSLYWELTVGSVQSFLMDLKTIGQNFAERELSSLKEPDDSNSSSKAANEKVPPHKPQVAATATLEQQLLQYKKSLDQQQRDMSKALSRMRQDMRFGPSRRKRRGASRVRHGGHAIADTGGSAENFGGSNSSGQARIASATSTCEMKSSSNSEATDVKSAFVQHKLEAMQQPFDGVGGNQQDLHKAAALHVRSGNSYSCAERQSCSDTGSCVRPKPLMTAALVESEQKYQKDIQDIHCSMASLNQAVAVLHNVLGKKAQNGTPTVNCPMDFPIAVNKSSEEVSMSHFGVPRLHSYASSDVYAAGARTALQSEHRNHDPGSVLLLPTSYNNHRPGERGAPWSGNRSISPASPVSSGLRFGLRFGVSDVK